MNSTKRMSLIWTGIAVTVVAVVIAIVLFVVLLGGETPMESDAESESVTNTESTFVSERESDSANESVRETVTESSTGIETESAENTPSETEATTESESETESVSATESESVSAIETETESETETETETETESETESEIETETESETESETEHAHTPMVMPGKAPTCTEPGLSESKHCSVCSAVIVAPSTIPATGHTPVVMPGKAPTCTEPGLSESKHCAVCGVGITASVLIPATGHNYNDGNTCIECGHTVQPTEGLSYRLISNNTAYEVVGIGTATDPAVIIPATYNGLPVKRIAQNAFKKNTSIVSVTIPDSVTSLQLYAFGECTNLKTVHFGKGLTYIGSQAFYGCTNLESAYLPDGLLTISSEAFRGCEKLSGLTIPDSVSYIGLSAFYKCHLLVENENGIHYVSDWVVDCDYWLKSAVVREGTYGISQGGFYYVTELTSISIPDSVMVVNNGAFLGSDKVVEIENGVHYVDKWAIGHDSLISYAVIREGTVGIANIAFANNEKLLGVTIPSSMQKICDNAFSNCWRMEQILFIGTEEQWNSIMKHSNWDYAISNFSITFKTPDLTASSEGSEGLAYTWIP